MLKNYQVFINVLITHKKYTGSNFSQLMISELLLNYHLHFLFHNTMCVVSYYLFHKPLTSSISCLLIRPHSILQLSTSTTLL